jgi:hypothetical protein
MMKAAGSSETLVPVHQIAWPHIPEDSNIHDHRTENPQSLLVQDTCVQFGRTFWLCS